PERAKTDRSARDMPIVSRLAHRPSPAPFSTFGGPPRTRGKEFRFFCCYPLPPVYAVTYVRSLPERVRSIRFGQTILKKPNSHEKGPIMAGQEWHYSFDDDDRRGPVDTSELSRLAADGELQPDHLVWKKGMAEWVPARRVKGLKFAAA